MRVNAYVLAGDPAWIKESISSYYHLVDRIVVSFDETGTSWAGRPLPVEAAVSALDALDQGGKMIHQPGRFSDPSRHAMELETRQRQRALDVASEGADWVLQLDTDEILQDVDAFGGYLRDAERVGADALDFPLRNFYALVGPRVYLESCDRLWRPIASYPGPLAVRAGVRLRYARQAHVPAYRVDLRANNTDPAHPRDARVDAVVGPAQAALHMSWVRSRAEMHRKSEVSGHGADFDWRIPLRRWEWRQEHPFLTVAATPFRRGPGDRFRLTRVPSSQVMHSAEASE